jgi:hypothetical protein
MLLGFFLAFLDHLILSNLASKELSSLSGFFKCLCYAPIFDSNTNIIPHSSDQFAFATTTGVVVTKVMEVVLIEVVEVVIKGEAEVEARVPLQMYSLWGENHMVTFAGIFFFLISNSFIEEEPPSIQEIYLMI